MRKELHEIALIEKYLQKDLGEEEQQTLEQKIEEDEDFKASVLLQASVVAGIQYYGLKNEIAQVHQNFVSGRGGNSSWKWILSGIIGALILSSVLWISKQNRADVTREAAYHQKILNTVSNNFNYNLSTEEDWEFERKKRSVAYETDTDNLSKKAGFSHEIEPEILSKDQNKFSFSSPFPEQEKQTIVFNIDNTKDTILYGLNGMEFYVPAGIFDTKNPEEISLEVTKYDKYSEMMLAKLSTQATHQTIKVVPRNNEMALIDTAALGKTIKPLETAGMVNLIAQDQTGEVGLKNDKRIGIYFPQSAGKNDWKLFDGVHGVNYIRWEEQSNSELGAANVNFSSLKPSNPANIKSPLYKEPKERRFGLNINGWRRIGPGQDTWVTKIPQKDEALTPYYPDIDGFFEENIEYPNDKDFQKYGGTVSATFFIDTSGTLCGIQFQNSSADYLSYAVYQAALKMGKWNVPRVNNQKSVSTYTKTFRFLGKKYHPKKMDKKYPNKTFEFEFKPEDTLKLSNWTNFSNGPDLSAEYRRRNQTKPYLWSNNLNFINCDRFVGERGLHSVYVQGQNSEEAVYMLFSQIHSAMAISGNQFINIPNNYDVKIVSFYIENGVYMVREVSASSSEKEIRLPEAVPMSKEAFIHLVDGVEPAS